MNTAVSTPFDAPRFVRSLTQRPGVYRMLDAAGEVLYVGKARNLRRRVASYFKGGAQPAKLMALVAQVQQIEITVTHTETEALLLEAQLIKRHRPRYNVVLRDDKSYPYIYLSAGEPWPRLAFHRGGRGGKGRYFGPYPSAGAARESLNLLQKVFPIRQCEDTVFQHRTRPCLQYQIKRCTAPCVGLVSPERYAADVRDAELFLTGGSGAVIDSLGVRMEAAAGALDFEAAARLRDQIATLRRIQERQYVSGERGDLDLLAVVVRDQLACVQLFFVRGGLNLGNQAFFPQTGGETDAGAILAAFLTQYYPGRDIPAEILLSHPLPDAGPLAAMLSEQAGRKVTLVSEPRGERARWVALAMTNAEQAMLARLQSQASMNLRLAALQDALEAMEPIARMECFDISHTQGEATVASCVVFDANGPRKSDYRRFNIAGIAPGDDYAAMRQALTRRYARIQTRTGVLPDVLFIDGGKGQVNAAMAVLGELAVTGVRVVGVAKGPERRPGEETLVLGEGLQELHLAADSPALHLIQQIRDEAHRFAITGHRARRARARTASMLEDIPHLGPRRRAALLRQFGGVREVARAGIDDLSRVKGISMRLAREIYAALHQDH